MFYILPDISLLYSSLLSKLWEMNLQCIWHFFVIETLLTLPSAIPNFLTSEILPCFPDSSLSGLGQVQCPQWRRGGSWRDFPQLPSSGPPVCTWWKTSVPCKNFSMFCFPVSSSNVASIVQDDSCTRAQKQTKRTARKEAILYCINWQN